MDLDILKAFCNEIRAATATPFSAGEHTFATDGYILLRVPRMAEVPERDDAPKIDTTEGNLGFSLSKEPLSWVPIPKVELKYRPCNICNGTGRMYECPECDGDGNVEWSSDFHEYEDECRMCGGSGTVSAEELKRQKINPEIRKLTDLACPDCCTQGQESKGVPIDPGVMIGDTRFSIVLLHRLHNLSDVEIGTINPYAPARIRFAGGDGLLMPMRPVA